MPRLPVLRGALRGAWWDPASGGKVLRVLTGGYEPEQTALFQRHVGPGATVLDVGAHVGYYTLLAARLAGPGGRVVAFEPDPRNAARLRRHVRMNRLPRTDVVEAAVAARAGEAAFARGSGSGTGRLAAEGPVRVRTVTVDEQVEALGLAPDVVKIDVEGAERAVLEGARETLARHRPVLFLSTHGAEPHADCSAFLSGMGYRLEPILEAELLCLPASAGPSGPAGSSPRR